MTAPSSEFNDRAAASVDEARRVLTSLGIAFEEKPDGSLFVPGDINLRDKDLTELPDLTSVSVGGSFNCSWNKLTTLKGAPATVGGGFYCHKNKLISLEGAPAAVGTNFNCSDNQLPSLKHAPAKVGESFCCDFNQLAFLEGIPAKVGNIVSDFGQFPSWGSVPPEIRACPETRARQNEAIAVEATVVQSPIFIKSALRLKTAAFPMQL